MIREVNSCNPLEEVDWHPRYDGKADIRIRHNIHEKTFEFNDQNGNKASSTLNAADEAYVVKDLTRAEALEQKDALWTEAENS